MINPAPDRSADQNPEPGLETQALRRELLAWWDVDGRHTIPWKLRPDGSRPGPGEPLDPFGVWVAEATRA